MSYFVTNFITEFGISGGNRALTVAANSQEEKDRWKQDLLNAIQQARDKTDAKITYLSLKSCSKLMYQIIVAPFTGATENSFRKCKRLKNYH